MLKLLLACDGIWWSLGLVLKGLSGGVNIWVFRDLGWICHISREMSFVLTAASHAVPFLGFSVQFDHFDLHYVCVCFNPSIYPFFPISTVWMPFSFLSVLILFLFVTLNPQTGKSTFVEHRTFLHLYRSFHRLWIFLVVMFQVIFVLSPAVYPLSFLCVYILFWLIHEVWSIA